MLSILTQSPVGLSALYLTAIYILYHLTLTLLTTRRHRIFARTHGCLPIPRYPHRDPIFGIDLFLENGALMKTGGYMERVRARYHSMHTNTFSLLLLGSPQIFTCEPENIKALLATQFKDFELPPQRKAAFVPVLGHGIFTSDGAEWEKSRAMLKPNFTRSQVGDLETFDAHIGKLIERIPSGEMVDLQPLFYMLTMDSATDFLFGTSSNVLGTGGSHERGNMFAEAFGYCTRQIGLQARVGKLATLWPDAKYEASKRYVHDYIALYIDQAAERRSGFSNEKIKEGPKERYVFLDELMKLGISETKIRAELTNILLAGRDSTASLLGYVFYHLARDERVMAKLREEMRQFGGEAPPFEQLKGMKYLQHVLSETLRLHPIVPGNSRYAIRDTTLPVGGGPDQKSPILVKKGQLVAYQVWVMQRRRDLYGEDADEFKPERWETLRTSWQYLPFNGGPRVCIGQQFALTEVAFTTVRLLQAFKNIEPRDDAILTDFLTITSAVRGGVKVVLTPA